MGVHGAEEIEGGAGAGAGKDRDGAVAEGGGTEEACGVEGVGEERGGWGGRSYLGKRRLGLRGERERERNGRWGTCAS